jgi:hypothetical protein
MPSLREHTNGIIGALEEAGLVVGDARGDVEPNSAGVPADGGWQGTPGDSPFKPYVVVRRLPGGRLDGTIAAPNDDASLQYEVKAIGNTRDGAERVADTARTVMLAGPPIEGRNTLRCYLESDTGVQRDDLPKPPLFYSVERFRLDTTPA